MGRLLKAGVVSMEIKLPKGLLDLSEAERQKVLDKIAESLKLPKTITVYTKGSNEHNMWERSSHVLLADLEDAFYEELYLPWREAVATLVGAMDLPLPQDVMEKAFSGEYKQYLLEKAKKDDKNKRSKISEIVERARQKREQFIKFISENAKPWTRKELKKVDDLLKKALPNPRQIVEKYLGGAMVVGKLNHSYNSEELDRMEMTGLYVESLPNVLQLKKDEDISLTVKTKNGQKNLKVYPLTPIEKNALQNAVEFAGDKIEEISSRHRAQIRQLVIKAKQERWTADQLARALFDRLGDQNRDWRRVAITELSYSMNNGFLAGCSEGDTVIGVGSVEACPACKKHVIGKVYTVTHRQPQNTHDFESKYLWVGKSNYGRSVASYIPCAPLHPHCRCRWTKVSNTFYKVDENGNLRRKTASEIIQEERAKRGLPPDPNIG